MSHNSKRKKLPRQSPVTPAQNDASLPRFVIPVICVLLAAMVWFVYGQTLHHKFVSYDDNVYVYENPVVKRGVTLHGIAWAFTYGSVDYWHPLTWLSHMMDCQFYGLDPEGHHLTNVLLHAAAAILLFLVLQRMTGALWRSAFVAAVFAVHPLHAESVAWVAERKDVLSGLFFVLTLAAYVRYVRSTRSAARYTLVAILFALGLMCKGMLVTLPCVLLLLDWWPLRRWTPGDCHDGPVPAREKQETPYRLVIEKIPLFALSAISCIITALMPHKVASLDQLLFLVRMENAVVCFVIYMRQMVWPSGLAVPYPNPAGHIPAVEVLQALALLVAISAVVFLFGKKRPWLTVGWLWYLGMLVPVIGIIQIASYAHADRYTYLPQIGLYIAVAWQAVEGCARLRHARLFIGSVSVMILAALMLTARTQTSYWEDDNTLWTHTLAVMPDNAVAHNNLGSDFELNGRTDEALDQFRLALAIKPDYPEAHTNLGNALFDKGEADEAIVQYEKALEIVPDYAVAHNNLGNVLLQKGKVDEAIAHCRRAVELAPDYAEAHNNLGNALNAKDESKEAITHYRKAIEISPDFASAEANLANTLLITGQLDEAMIHYHKAIDLNPNLAGAHGNLGNILLQKGRLEEAAGQFEEALKIQPEYPETENNLAHILAASPHDSLRNGTRALDLASKANRSTGGGNPVVLGTLASAYAENAQFSEAQKTAQKAMDIATSQGLTSLADMLREQMAIYLKNLPLRDDGKEK